VGGISTDNNGSYSSLHGQQHATVNAGFELGLSTFGQAKVAGSHERSGVIDLQRLADQIRAAVVSSHQSSLTHAALIPLARQQVDSAEEVLRLAQANLQAGTMLTIDVLQAQDALQLARLGYVDAVMRYNQAQVNLRATLGLLDGTAGAVSPATQPAAQN
jgi:outer membrane protein TolC